MKQTLLTTDVTHKFAHMLVVAEAKVGKTCGIIASSMGLMPGQKSALVEDPSHIHILGCDRAAAERVYTFATNLCGGDPESVGKVNVYTYKEEIKAIFNEDSSYNYDFFNRIMADVLDIKATVKRVGGTHLVVVSTLTTMVELFRRSISGSSLPANGKKQAGSGMDIDKWQMLSGWLAEFRNKLFDDTYHVVYESHVVNKPIPMDKRAKPENAGVDDKETLAVPGSAGINFPLNVDNVVRMRREVGQTYKDSKVERIFFDTSPDGNYLAGGRGALSVLSKRETDFVEMLRKLGKTVAP